MSRPNAKIRSVAKDILLLRFEAEMTLDHVKKIFFKIMRKHGIKRMTKKRNGREGDNFEWTMCRILFQHELERQLDWDFTIHDAPKDLDCY